LGTGLGCCNVRRGAALQLQPRLYLFPVLMRHAEKKWQLDRSVISFLLVFAALVGAVFLFQLNRTTAARNFPAFETLKPDERFIYFGEASSLQVFHKLHHLQYG